MSYADRLRRLLVGFQPRLDHLYLLEPFQVLQLLERLGPDQLALLVRYDPTLRRVLEAKVPSLQQPLETAIATNTPLEGAPAELLWEVADLLVYNVAPDLFDAVVPAPTAETLDSLAHLHGTVADVGAGTGRMAMSLARKVQHVFAVEPVGALRRFMKSQRRRLSVGNLYVVDGLLHDLPFPNDALDAVITRSALGWRLNAELDEIDRVVRLTGSAIHLTGISMRDDVGRLHARLSERGYELHGYPEGRTACRAYVKAYTAAEEPPADPQGAAPAP